MTEAIKARRVDVDSKDGVVTLSGVVSTPAAKETAAQLAAETDGVSRVVNDLRLDPRR